MSVVPRNVVRGCFVSVGWYVIVVIMWVVLGMYKSSYYSFGPSDTLVLAFTNVPIDTQVKYWSLMAFIVVQCFVQVYSGDNVYPWINAVVMNPGVAAPSDPRLAYVVANSYWSLNTLSTIFFFALGFAQVDFALAIAVTSSIAGWVTSYFIVFDSERPHDPAAKQRLLGDANL